MPTSNLLLDAYFSVPYHRQLETIDIRWCLVIVLLFASVQYALAVPAELRHLPRVSPYAMIWSHARRESVDSRVRRLILPFAKRGDGVVLVYMLGKWGVHVVDPALVKIVCQDMNRFPKKNYQDHLHFTFLSGPNVVFSNGDMWKRHSASVKTAFDREIPVHRFVTLAHELFERIGDGGIHRFSDLVQCYTLDVVGTALLGHNFQALQASKDSFVDHFNRVMSRIATPTRLIFPFLDDWFPRHAVLDDVNALNARYDDLLKMKRQDLGHDLLSYLLEDSTLSSEELRSNLAILFSAGHDTTSGALSTAVYHLAKHPEYQSKAREEAQTVLNGRVEPTLQDLSNLPFLSACIKEALRINSPISLLPARWTLQSTMIGKYAIPAHTSVVPNICAVHQNDNNWPEAQKFDPYRFIGTRQRDVKAVYNVPFGSGPRQCVARQFSLFEQRTLLCMLLLNYEWSLPEKSMHEEQVQNEFGAFGLSIPHALDIKFVRRN